MLFRSGFLPDPNDGSLYVLGGKNKEGLMVSGTCRCCQWAKESWENPALFSRVCACSNMPGSFSLSLSRSFHSPSQSWCGHLLVGAQMESSTQVKLHACLWTSRVPPHSGLPSCHLFYREEAGHMVRGGPSNGGEADQSDYRVFWIGLPLYPPPLYWPHRYDLSFTHM